MLNELLNLYLAFLKVGAFSFGGAYSLVPIIEREIVTAHPWLSQEEFLKILSMVEVFPGAISIKFATYTGYKAAGIPGAITANLGNMTVPFLLILTASYFYNYFEKNETFFRTFEGVKYAVLGMILAIVYQYTIKNYANWKSIVFLVLGFSLTIFFKLHPVLIVAVSALLGLALSFI